MILRTVNLLYLNIIFGIIGEEMYYHAHGIDMSLIQDKLHYSHGKKVLDNLKYFLKITTVKIFKIILRETVDEVARRLRHARMTAQTIALGVGFSKSYGVVLENNSHLNILPCMPMSFFKYVK